jgi:Na+/H+-dicarboxylate symporter
MGETLSSTLKYPWTIFWGRRHGILWHSECQERKLAHNLEPDHEMISDGRNDHDCSGSLSNTTALAMSSNRNSYNLPLWVAVGALAGILAGIFFGEYCRILSPVGSAYVMLLQVVVYPYIICSLLHGLGRLSPPTALRLLKRGWFLLFLVWAVTFGTIFLLIQAIPSPEGAAVVDPAAATSSKSNLLALLIPANPFLALADNYVPAVVIMAILYGVAIQHYKKKASFLETLDVIRTASVKIWNWVVLLAPFAVFALFADTAGTVDLGQLKDLLVYVFLFTAGSCILAFWLLPWLMSALAPVTPKAVIREIQGGIVLAVATTLSVVALPSIMEATRKLAEQNGIGEDEERDEIINTTLAVSYPLGQLGNFFVFLFVPFAAYTFDVHLSGFQTVLAPFLYPAFLPGVSQLHRKCRSIPEQLARPAARRFGPLRGDHDRYPLRPGGCFRGGDCLSDHSDNLFLLWKASALGVSPRPRAPAARPFDPGPCLLHGPAGAEERDRKRATLSFLFPVPIHHPRGRRSHSSRRVIRPSRRRNHLYPTKPLSTASAVRGSCGWVTSTPSSRFPISTAKGIWWATTWPLPMKWQRP